MKSIIFYSWLAASAMLYSALPAQRRHDNEQVISLPYSRTTLKTLRAMHLDVWGVQQKEGISVRVNSAQLKQLKQELPAAAQDAKVVIKNVQALIEASSGSGKFSNVNSITPGGRRPPTPTGKGFHSDYHSYADIVQWLQKLSKDYSSVVSYTSSIGQSSEKRDIPLIKITGTKGGEKKHIWLQGMQHAREWITGASMLYMSEALASQYGKDSAITKLLDQVEFVILPVCNPDGYEYSRTTDRMWRKTRGEKDGVDSNRNWPDHWNSGGSTSDPEDEVYMGEAAGSTPEVQALMAEYKKTANVLAAVDFHSFSRLILSPYGWTDKRSRDEDSFNALGKVMKQAFEKDGQGEFTSERVVDLYVASGGANDWFYNAGTPVGQMKPYGMSIELPPSSPEEGGFILPPSRIIPIGKATTNAIVAMSNHVLEHPLGLKTSDEAI